MQYQKLLDHRPAEITSDTASVDPILGYQFLENGVVQCLPFLSKIWQNRDKELASICDQDLIEAGVQNPADRTAILTSISNYYDYLNRRIEYPEVDLSPSTSASTAPALEEEDEPVLPSSPPDESSAASGAVQFSECVVCLEETVRPDLRTFSSKLILFFHTLQVQVIFLPCGHMCCCAECHVSIRDCPMCRAYIERKIRVIQP